MPRQPVPVNEQTSFLASFQSSLERSIPGNPCVAGRLDKERDCQYSRNPTDKPFIGEMSERSKEAVLKTVEAQVSGGSNPSLSVLTSYYDRLDVIGEVREWPNRAPC